MDSPAEGRASRPSEIGDEAAPWISNIRINDGGRLIFIALFHWFYINEMFAVQRLQTTTATTM
jgi:hypothetical protein